MKSYTNIEQSKKLIEILPLESADMYWLNRHIDLTETKYEVFIIDKSNKNIDFFKSYAVAIDNNEIIPCWSLAALIDVLPLVETHKQTDGHKIYYYVELYMKRMGKEIYLSTERHESLVDACYEMILKLQYMKGE